MKVILALMFLVVPGQPPKIESVPVSSIEDCIEMAIEFLNNEKFRGLPLRGASCTVVGATQEAEH